MEPMHRIPSKSTTECTTGSYFIVQVLKEFQANKKQTRNPKKAHRVFTYTSIPIVG